MKPIDLPTLRKIARSREISYRAIADPDPLVIRTRMSKVFPLAQTKVFNAFADPQSHVPLFSIIKGSTPAIRSGIERLLPENQFFAFEHVEESTLPPRLMLVRYTLEKPRRIIKEAVTDPFGNDKGQIRPLDKKKGRVVMTFQRVSPKSTRIVAESTFQATTGAIFARPFVDLVWLNFFERVMLANGLLTRTDMLTR